VDQPMVPRGPPRGPQWVRPIQRRRRVRRAGSGVW
jgi:hypothetical protein